MMWHCKDCLHYKVCIWKNNLDSTLAARCDEFSDRSEWAHLPCKVGDTLYEITSRNTISEYEVTAIRIELFNIFVDWKLIQGFVDRHISDMPVGELGKTVFLTREAAEKALEEKKNEYNRQDG